MKSLFTEMTWFGFIVSVEGRSMGTVNTEKRPASEQGHVGSDRRGGGATEGNETGVPWLRHGNPDKTFLIFWLRLINLST